MADLFDTLPLGGGKRDIFDDTPIPGEDVFDRVAVPKAVEAEPNYLQDLGITEEELGAKPTGREMLRSVPGAAEGALALGSGFLSWIPAGLAGAGLIPMKAVEGAVKGDVLGSLEEATDVVGDIQEALTYKPKRDIGKELADVGGMPFLALSDLGHRAGNYLADKTGSPALATVVGTAIEGAPFLAGLGVHARSRGRGVAKSDAVARGVAEPDILELVREKVKEPLATPPAEVVEGGKASLDPFDKIEIEGMKRGVVQTFDEFSATRGVPATPPSFPETHKIPGGVSKATRRVTEKRIQAENARWMDARDAVRAEYEVAVADGVVRPPTGAERLQAIAEGEGPSAEAARRVIEKRKGRMAEAKSGGSSKEPWQMTRKEFWLEHDKGLVDWQTSIEEITRLHRESVSKALSSGKSVPPEVLKDYPDLQAKGAAQTSGIAKEPWQMTKVEFVGEEPIIPEGNTSTIARRFGKAGPTPEQLKEWNANKNARARGLREHKKYVEKSNEHIASIQGAIAEGKSVPFEAIKDYPFIVKDGLRNKEFHGTIDRLERGEIDLEQAYGELVGTKKPTPPRPSSLDPYEVASELKRAGVDRQESWSRWVQKTSLKPGMDAKEWYRIYDAVSGGRGGTTLADVGRAERLKEQTGAITVTREAPAGAGIFPEAQELAYQEAKGVREPTRLEKAREYIQTNLDKLTREYEHLPKTKEFAEARFALKRVEKANQIADYDAKVNIGEIVAPLDAKSYDTFSRKVYLEDLTHGLERGHRVPAEWTPELTRDTLARLDTEIAKDPRVQEALTKRQAVWDEMRDKYTGAMEAIGFDVSERFTNPNYFRHQVLEYAKMNELIGAGKKLKTPSGRSFLKQRKGSTLDYNTDYIQAELDVLSKMHNDIIRAEAIRKIKDKYDISARVRADAKAKGIDDWRQAIPDTHTTFQPREGNVFFFADSVPERLAKKLWSGEVEKLGVTAEDLQSILAVGKRRTEWVIPKELEATLENLTRQRSKSAVIEGDRKIIRGWKQWQLISPRRYAKYNFRNLSGDADATFVGNPASFKKIPQAVRDLADVYFRKKEMSPDLREWFERGGFESTLQTQEMGEIKRLWPFERLHRQGADLNVWKKYWRAARLSTDFREAILRYSSFLSYKEQMLAGGGIPKNFGASIPNEIMGLSSVSDRAYWLANDLLGAYDRVGITGQAMSDHVFPFWRWKEVNFTRYKRMAQNAANDGRIASAVGRKVLGSLAFRSPYIAIRTGRFMLKATAFWSALQVWNNFMYPDLEDALPENVKTSPHIIFGQDKDGKIQYFNRMGALGDLLEWFGLDAAPQYVSRWFRGKEDLKDIAKDMAVDSLQSPANVLFQGSFPFVKLGYESLSRRSTFPDIFRPGTIRDRGLHLARSFGLENEYIALTGKPSRGYKKSLGGFVGYSLDPKEGAYRNILEEVSRFNKKNGKITEGFWITPRGNAMYNAKLALRYGDKVAFEKYLGEYADLGGTKEGWKRSLKTMHPLWNVDRKDRGAFVDSLDEEGKAILNRAIEFYNGVIAGNQF